MFQLHGELGKWFTLHTIFLPVLMALNRFKGAYCTVLEQEALTDLFGEMDVIDDTLPGMAEMIIAHQAAK